MWKVFAGIMAEQVYIAEQGNMNILQSRETKVQLILDKMVMENCKRRMANFCVAQIDYAKAYDTVLRIWILQYLKTFKVAN